MGKIFEAIAKRIEPTEEERRIKAERARAAEEARQRRAEERAAAQRRYDLYVPEARNLTSQLMNRLRSVEDSILYKDNTYSRRSYLESEFERITVEWLNENYPKPSY